MSTEKIQGCELCPGTARMYCESDEARLCFDCDGKVHSANFLVARHCRTLLCRSCQGPTPWKAEGARLGPTMSVCQRCINGKTVNVIDDNKSSKDDGEEEEDYEEEEEESEEEEGEEQVVPGVEEGDSLDAISSSCCSSNGEGEEEEDDEENEEESPGYYVKSKRTRQNALLDLFSNSQDEQANSPLLNQTEEEDKGTSNLSRPLKLQKKPGVLLSHSRQSVINCPPI